MKKQLMVVILSFALILTTIFSMSGQAFANSEKQGQIVNGVNFRSQPSVSGKQIRMLKKGETVEIIQQVNSYWYKIKDRKGIKGYVSANSKYVKTSFSDNTPTQKQKRTKATGSNASQKVINAGMKYLGTPYKFGSNRNSTATFDCSDFVRRAYIDGANLKLPANSRSQGDYVKKQGKVTTNWRQLKPGDIMFFMTYKGSKASDYAGIKKSTERITHNGIYIGEGKILHTYSKKSGGVRIDSISGSHWEKRFLFGGSPL